MGAVESIVSVPSSGGWGPWTRRWALTKRSSMLQEQRIFDELSSLYFILRRDNDHWRRGEGGGFFFISKKIFRLWNIRLAASSATRLQPGVFFLRKEERPSCTTRSNSTLRGFWEEPDAVSSSFQRLGILSSLQIEYWQARQSRLNEDRRGEETPRHLQHFVFGRARRIPTCEKETRDSWLLKGTEILLILC